jgi:acyl-CoA dehydrogenase family protein 9
MRQESFIRSLFCGAIDESLIFPWPEVPAAHVKTVHGLLERIRRFLEQTVDASEIDRLGRIPDPVLRGLRQLGCFGMLIPSSFGGLGLSTSAYARVLQDIAAADSSVAVTIAAHQALGAKALLLFGSESQKSLYLPRLATGEIVAAFALTETAAGSDAAALDTYAERQPDGSYRITGSKIWVTNGGIGDLFTVFARTSPPDEGVKPKLTAFLVERGPGVTTGANTPKLGIRGASTTDMSFDGVRVAPEGVLGEAGRGYKVAMEVLTGARLGLSSRCVGLCKRVIKLSVDRCQERRAFGRPIGEFGLIKDKIATMVADTWALESITYLTTGIVDAGVEDFAVESAICKVFGSETCWRVVHEALQIAAGIGYMVGRPYERLLRDAQVNLIFEGTNEILRAFIALSGMQAPAKEIAEVARAMREPIKGFGLLGEFAIRKARGALGRPRLTRHDPALYREAAVFEAYVHELSRGVDKVLRKHGRDIAEMQYTQKRTADMAIDLYAIAACISRTTRAIQRRGHEGARRELDLTSVFVSTAERRLAQTVEAIDKNDDELRKAVASKTYVDGRYPFDVV